jgi:hypothetical protein
MTAVIIDNSTLSAVQRLAGTIPAPNSYDAQGDYSALENLFVHLLFFDDYYFVDDYKEEFRSARMKEFSFIHPIPPSSFPYSEIEALAVAKTKQLILDIRGGKQTDGLLKEFLEEINLHVACAWHMQSSDYFLTLKILSDEPDTLAARYKYSPLTAMIFQQLSHDASNHVPPNLIGSDGQAIASKENRGDRSYVVGSELRHFSNSLNWLARRTAFFAFLSAHFDAAMSLHPIRHNFLARWSSKGAILTSSSVWRRKLGDFFGSKSAEAVNAINASTDAIEIGADLPLFAAWAVGVKGNVRDALSFIVEISQRPQTIALRKHFDEIDARRSGGDIAQHKRAINDLRAAIELEARKLVEKCGGSNASSVPSISINAPLLPVPGLSFSTKADAGNLKIKFGPARRARTLLRNVVKDVIGFEELGKVRGALLRNVRRSEEHSIPALRIEEKRYFGRGSSWKEPM